MRRKFSLHSGKKRTGVIGFLILLAFALVVLRLFWLQIITGNELARRSVRQTTGEEKVYSPRGSILDRHGEELAVSIMSKSLYVDPQQMDDNPELWARGEKPKRDPRRLAADLLAPVLKMKADDLFADFSSEGRFLWIKRAMEPDEADAVRQIIKENKFSGLHFLQESKRYYTKNTMAAHVLGFVGIDDNGLSGIEWALDSLIKGAENRKSEILDALGRPIAESGFNSATPPEMATVYLTIDNKMQYVLEKGLDDAIAKTHAKSAAVILMDPNTGEILGMASRPTYDPNKFSEYPMDALKNRAISIIYEPGSVFKPIVGCAGLSENLVSPNTPFYDGGAFNVADRTIRNWDGGSLGAITFTDVIKFSVNTGMADLGMRLGGQKLTDYTKKFGFGKATGIELPGEEDGILYDPEEMRLPDIATMSIGQGVAVSPLQMLRAICAIANGGELVKPYIVQKVVSQDGKVLMEGKKQVVRRVITEEVAEQMRSMMEQVVSDGGGKTARIQGYKIAGKTGTAEKLSENGGYAAGVYIASFVGFVPSDSPQYAMLIMLDSPQGAFYGSQVSAPVFRDTLQQILVAQGIQPSTTIGLPSLDTLKRPENYKQLDQMPQMQIMPDGKAKIPNFAGLNIRQVAELIQQGRLVLIPHGSGTAKKQSLPPGTILGQGTLVEVWFE
ncbi:MAG: peptidoglycan glycosyltransferase [Negativicutes bacterium]|nr:peptidoglycan glycosyltransferase [Negativicutes bacterium]